MFGTHRKNSLMLKTLLGLLAFSAVACSNDITALPDDVAEDSPANNGQDESPEAQQSKRDPRTDATLPKTNAPVTQSPTAPSQKSQTPVPLVSIDRSRSRDLTKWKPEIAAYSQRHYHEHTWELKPKAVVLHYTAATTFPWNLVNSTESDGEKPGLASHYVVDGTKSWQILPNNVRSRCTYGANHRALSIEIVALNEDDLYYKRKQSLDTTAKLVFGLMKEFNFPISEIRSHEEVDRFDGKIPWVIDYVSMQTSGKSDPGEKNMRDIISRVSRLL